MHTRSLPLAAPSTPRGTTCNNHNTSHVTQAANRRLVVAGDREGSLTIWRQRRLAKSASTDNKLPQLRFMKNYRLGYPVRSLALQRNTIAAGTLSADSPRIYIKRVGRTAVVAGALPYTSPQVT